MDELLHLLDSCAGVRSLTLYQQDGLCWHKRGELRVTPALVAELRAAEVAAVYREPAPIGTT